MENNKRIDRRCPSCFSRDMMIFHEVKAVPSNSCILLRTQKEAIEYPKGDISLGFCLSCGFISNLVFDPKLTEYSGRYEETQGFSPTFNAFHKDLAHQLIQRYQLYGKEIIEIGCGKGEFLTVLCEIGGNHGIGFDPAYVSERNKCQIADQINFIKDFYSEKYSHFRSDFLVCKMTLEHVPTPFDFVSMIRRAIGDRSETMVFFQVPDVSRILKNCAFEDIYYEHCSYFSPGSIACLFRKCGFTVLDLRSAYSDQYLMIEANLLNGRASFPFSPKKNIEQLNHDVSSFQKRYIEKLNGWKVKFEEIRAKRSRVVLWGSGSKGVAFLTSLRIINEISYVVDINPFRQGFYMPGTGQEIVAPGFLRNYQPDIVIVMNPIYCEEIRRDLELMGQHPEILTT